MPVRLQKYLAESGVASRRKAEALIIAGQVKVNGVTVDTLGFCVDERTDIVTFGGQAVKPAAKKFYVMLNKPEGCITTVKDQFGRSTVMDFIDDIKERLIPVGRLDYDTSGLLLLTNDGGFLYAMTHPGHCVNKSYIAEVEGIPSEAELQKLRRGFEIDGYTTSPALVRVVKAGKLRSKLEVIIHEGRNRQVRKMFEAIGHRVISLKRTHIGDLALGDLKKGEYRFLTEKEIENLKIKAGILP